MRCHTGLSVGACAVRWPERKLSTPADPQRVLSLSEASGSLCAQRVCAVSPTPGRLQGCPVRHLIPSRQLHACHRCLISCRGLFLFFPSSSWRWCAQGMRPSGSSEATAVYNTVFLLSSQFGFGGNAYPNACGISGPDGSVCVGAYVYSCVCVCVEIILCISLCFAVESISCLSPCCDVET